MPKQQYQIATKTGWMSSSGNAMLALYNNAGSQKKVNIHSIEIYNNTRLGANLTANAQQPATIKLRFGPVTGLFGGDLIAPAKHDTNAASWPSTVRITSDSSFAPVLIQRGSTLTMAGATAGSATFTPGATPAPAWTTNEHRSACRYFVSTSGNVGTYRITSNTATQLTLTHTFAATASTVGYIAEPRVFSMVPLLKMLNTSTTASLASTNFGRLNNRNMATAGAFVSSTNADTTDVIVAANEQVALYADFPHANVPVFVSATLVRRGSPNRTFTVSYYTYIMAEYSAIFAIDNQSGSGETIEVQSISVSEVGTHDTPYFQVVPISKVGSATAADTSRKITSQAFPNDSANPSLSSVICDVYTDVPVTAAGIPISYISDGSANATPKGFNYLNTKDFIGPTYMALFPEAAAFKREDATFWNNQTSGTLGTNVSQGHSCIKGCMAPIVIRESEGIAIVSGAETAAGGTINSVGVSGWQGFEFAITFSVENATTPSLVLTGLQNGSEVVVLNSSTGAVMSSEESNVSGTFSYAYDYAPGVSVDVIVHSLGYEYYRLNGISLTTTGVSIPVSQRVDRNYSNP